MSKLTLEDINVRLVSDSLGVQAFLYIGIDTHNGLWYQYYHLDPLEAKKGLLRMISDDLNKLCNEIV